MSRTRHYRDLIAWQKAMDLARLLYAATEEAHGRLNDAEMRKGLGSARASINELQTQTELAGSLGFFPVASTDEILDLATRVAKLINGLLGVLETDENTSEPRQPANVPSRVARQLAKRDQEQ